MVSTDSPTIPSVFVLFFGRFVEESLQDSTVLTFVLPIGKENRSPTPLGPRMSEEARIGQEVVSQMGPFILARSNS